MAGGSCAKGLEISCRQNGARAIIETVSNDNNNKTTGGSSPDQIIHWNVRGFPDTQKDNTTGAATTAARSTTTTRQHNEQELFETGWPGRLWRPGGRERFG